MKKLFLLFLSTSLFVSCKNDTASPPPTDATASKTAPPVEFIDAKYTEIGKKYLAAMESGDMDSYMSNYADNAKYYWNNGDSLVGKAAIDKFWRNRRDNVIETIKFEQNIWLPIKVNELENVPMTGNWLLSWYKVTAKYKGGKTMTQRMHINFHFDENDKIDMASQYVDRSLIEAAMPPVKK